MWNNVDQGYWSPSDPQYPIIVLQRHNYLQYRYQDQMP